MTSLVHSGANISKGVHMLTKIREYLYIADKNVTSDELREVGVTVALMVAQNSRPEYLPDNCIETYIELSLDKVNKPHIKDVACHIPKYMSQNGETVVVIDQTGLKQATYVVARAICEMEGKSIYEVFTELQTLLVGFDINGAYL